MTCRPAARGRSGRRAWLCAEGKPAGTAPLVPDRERRRNEEHHSSAHGRDRTRPMKRATSITLPRLPITSAALLVLVSVATVAGAGRALASPATAADRKSVV